MRQRGARRPSQIHLLAGQDMMLRIVLQVRAPIEWRCSSWDQSSGIELDLPPAMAPAWAVPCSLTPPPLLSLSSLRAELQRRGRTAAPAGQAPAARLSLAPAERAAVVLSLPPMAARSHPPSLPGALPACVSSAPSLLAALPGHGSEAGPPLPSPRHPSPYWPSTTERRTARLAPKCGSGPCGAMSAGDPRGAMVAAAVPHRNPAASQRRAPPPRAVNETSSSEYLLFGSPAAGSALNLGGSTPSLAGSASAHSPFLQPLPSRTPAYGCGRGRCQARRLRPPATAVLRGRSLPRAAPWLLPHKIRSIPRGSARYRARWSDSWLPQRLVRRCGLLPQRPVCRPPLLSIIYLSESLEVQNLPRQRPHPTWACHGGSARGQGWGGQSGAPRSTHRCQGQAGLHAARGSGVPRRAVARPATSGRRPQSGGGARASGRWRRSRGGRERAERGAVPLSSSSSDPKCNGVGASRRSRAPGRPRAGPFLLPRSGRGGGAPARALASHGGRAAGKRTLCSELLADSPSVWRQGPAGLKLTTQMVWACSELTPKQHNTTAGPQIDWSTVDHDGGGGRKLNVDELRVPANLLHKSTNSQAREHYGIKASMRQKQGGRERGRRKLATARRSAAVRQPAARKNRAGERLRYCRAQLSAARGAQG
ncbi:hypothetical protein PVAP13_3NG183152 [Panicum virgatum]|uniref:Uncharacterized protein n=1 Tax=Panicum virgatum TaxID=38727 RepID=A0A8T0UHB6_PANVG|nr:hypothetical protein PVAP13_3NG183152 [Panicum virgatum]